MVTDDNFHPFADVYLFHTEDPEMVRADVAEASGFASRTAFLRTFKAQTGLTPTEWKAQIL